MIYIKIAFKQDPTNWHLYSYKYDEETGTVIDCDGRFWGQYKSSIIGTDFNIIESFASEIHTRHWIVDVLTKDEVFLELL